MYRRIVEPFLRSGVGPYGLGAFALSGIAAMALSHVATPWFIAAIIDAAPNGDAPALRAACWGLFGVAILASYGGAARQIGASYLSDTFRVHLRDALIRHAASLPLSRIESRSGPRLNSVFIDDVPAIARLIEPFGFAVALAVIQLVSALAILITQFRSYAWIVLATIPVQFAVAAWQWPAIRAAAKELSQHKSVVDNLTSEMVEGARDLKTLGASGWLFEKVKRSASLELAARWRSYMLSIVDHARYSITWLPLSLVYYGTALSVASGDLTVGAMTAVIWYIGFLGTPISRLWYAASEWQGLKVSVDRYLEILAVSPEADGTITLSSDALPGIALRNVTFFYPDAATPALKDLSLTIRPGQGVAVVGPSGAGKTTLVSMLVGLFKPQGGTVSIAGHDIRDLTSASLRRYVALVSQEPFIVDGTVRENILLGLTGVSDHEVERAALTADAHAFILAMPEGYDSVLGTRGTRLSGGQKRRLAIARALVRRPGILIFDEVTGALDSISDEAIRDAIRAEHPECTTITISHRLSSTQTSDMIVVMEQGQVVGMGTHHGLLDSCSAYRRLSELQELSDLVA